jgi:hypothetical protein
MSYVRTILKTVEANAEQADLCLPHSIIRKCKIPVGDLTLRFGSSSSHVQVRGADAAAARISAALARRLYLPQGIPLILRYDSSRETIVMGPYIGILLLDVKSTGEPFGSLTPFMDEVADICHRRGGLVSVFTIADIDWDANTVRGMIRRQGSWQFHTLPLPQCIYNRVHSRHAEKSDQVDSLIQHCKDNGIPFFNERFLNKWNVYKILADRPAAPAFLPKTVCFKSSEDLKRMLQEFRTVYAKPANGSMGKGIYRIRAGANGYQIANSQSTRVWKDFSSLHRHLQKKCAGKLYLLQRGLSLIGFQSRPADFRVLVQKNRSGEWAVTSLVARIGQNRIVSNVARGGSMFPAAQALQMCGPWQNSSRPSVHTLSRTALQVARELEHSLDGHYAEFGIDLGVDVHGRIWLLEVNSKPSKSDQTVITSPVAPQSPRRPRPSVIRLLDYAAYLSGYKPLKRTGKSIKQLYVKSKKENRR